MSTIQNVERPPAAFFQKLAVAPIATTVAVVRMHGEVNGVKRIREKGQLQ